MSETQTNGPVEPTGMPHEDPRFEHLCNAVRDTLAIAERQARELYIRATRRTLDAQQLRHPAMALANEAASQAELAIRGVEDARMRVGKVMQYALQGGVSKYERTTEPAYEETK